MVIVLYHISTFQGTQAYLSRSSCYKHVISMLKRLMSASSSAGIRPASSATLPLKPGPPAPPDPNQLAPAEASEHADQVRISWVVSAMKLSFCLYQNELFLWHFSSNDLYLPSMNWAFLYHSQPLLQGYRIARVAPVSQLRLGSVRLG